MEKALIIIGPWCGALAALYLAVRTPTFYANCPRWLVMTIRISAASYAVMIALGQIFIVRSAETAQLVSAVVGFASILVAAIATIFAMSIGRRWRGPN